MPPRRRQKPSERRQRLMPRAQLRRRSASHARKHDAAIRDARYMPALRADMPPPRQARFSLRQPSADAPPFAARASDAPVTSAWRIYARFEQCFCVISSMPHS